MSVSPPYATNVAVPTSPPKFSSNAAGVDAKVWLKRFERYCLIANIDASSTCKITYFETFLIGAAEEWFLTSADNIRSNFDSLKEAFLTQYAGLTQPEETPALRYQLFLAAVRTKKTVDDLRDGEAWRKWLGEVLVLSNKVDVRYAPEELKASNFWAALPSELTQPNKVLTAVNACCSLPITVYEKIVAERDAMLKRKKDLEAQLMTQYEVNQAELTRILNNLRRQNALPPSPPEEKRARFTTPPPNGVVELNVILQQPKTPNVDMLSIPQLNYPDNADGHQRYEADLKKYITDHPRTTLYPHLDEAYPLTPGTEPPGTGECHQCGQQGHMYNGCTAEQPIPQPEQRYQQSYARALQNRSGNQ